LGRVPVDIGGNRQPAAARHGIPRVQEQVEKDLLELVFDALDDRRRRRKLFTNLNAASSELVLEQRQHIIDDGVYLDRTGVGLRRAGQVEQAVDNLGRPERLAFDLLEDLRLRVFRLR